MLEDIIFSGTTKFRVVEEFKYGTYIDEYFSFGFDEPKQVVDRKRELKPYADEVLQDRARKSLYPASDRNLY